MFVRRRKKPFTGFCILSFKEREITSKHLNILCRLITFELGQPFPFISRHFLWFPKICGENVGKGFSVQNKLISKLNFILSHTLKTPKSFFITDSIGGMPMARINIEDSLFKDARWWNLIIKLGCQYKGLGFVTKAWILAQEHWIEYGCVPEKAWPAEMDVLIEVGLAERREDGSIYVKGSKAAFAWLEQRVEAGRKGGTTKRDKKVKRPLADAKRPLPPAKPLTPTLPLSLPLTLTPIPAQSLTPPPFEDCAKAQKPDRLIAAYCRGFKSKYGTNPPIDKKTAGIAKRIVQSLSEDQIETYLKAFFEMPDAWLAKIKHPLGAFETNLNKIVVFANTGVHSDANKGKAISEAEKINEHNKSQLKRILDGEL